MSLFFLNIIYIRGEKTLKKRKKGQKKSEKNEKNRASRKKRKNAKLGASEKEKAQKVLTKHRAYAIMSVYGDNLLGMMGRQKDENRFFDYFARLLSEKRV